MTASKPKQRKVRKWLMPQEVEVWYVLPALRRELAKTMKFERGQAQKRIARMLGVTEPAVTQYMLDKKDKPKRSRGDQVKIPDSLKPELLKAADTIIEAWSSIEPTSHAYETTTREINRLITVLRDAGALCDIHREHCEGVHMDCNACNRE
ncbi:MAG: transcriptional regulator [Candidatus Thorarchaeota archaeon]